MSSEATRYAARQDIAIAPGTISYYLYDAGFYETCAREQVDEWSYSADPHGYCHERNVLVGLLAEIDRLRTTLGEAGAA